MTSDRFAFTVTGDAVPAVRMTQKSKHVDRQAQRYLAWKEHIGWTAQQNGATLMNGRLSVRLWFYLNKRRGRDWDNLAKAVCDGLNKVCYADDSQVDHAIVTVRTGYDPECVDVEIRRIV